MAEAGAMFGISGFRDIPYELEGHLYREGKRLRLAGGRLRAGVGTLYISGLLPEFPTIDDWQVDVDGDYVVDTGFIVAFESTLQYETTWLSGLKRGSGLKNLVFGGDGLVCKFRGRGKLWVQTRRVGAFLSWLTPFRRVEKRRGLDIGD